MTDIDVPDWVVEAAARVVAANAGEDFDRLGESTKDLLKSVQAECLRAALSAWVVPVGYVHEQVLSELNDCLAEPSLRAGGTIWSRQGGPFTEALYTLRQEKPE